MYLFSLGLHLYGRQQAIQLDRLSTSRARIARSESNLRSVVGKNLVTTFLCGNKNHADAIAPTHGSIVLRALQYSLSKTLYIISSCWLP